MAVRVGINGFGRIGRATFRSNLERMRLGDESVEIVAVNDPRASAEDMAYNLKHDSTRDRLSERVTVKEPDGFAVNDRLVQVFNYAQPRQIPWASEGVDVVIEATGKFKRRDHAAYHLGSTGAQKVIISAPSFDADAMLAMGINHNTYDPERHNVISGASCGVNALAVMIKALQSRYDIINGTLTCTLPILPVQNVHDTTGRQDPRVGRAAGLNIIPNDYQADIVLARLMPESGEKFLDETNFVPSPTVGAKATVTAYIGERTTRSEVNDVLLHVSRTSLKGLLEYENNVPAEDGEIISKLVSSDAKGVPASCLVEGDLTRVRGEQLQVSGWFDNEWGYSNRLLDMAGFVGGQLTSREVEPQAELVLTGVPYSGA